MSKTLDSQAVVRKPLLVAGGVVLAVALLALILMKFVGGGSNTALPPGAVTKHAPATTTHVTPAKPSSPSSPAKLRQGGRDPFRPVVGAPKSAPARP